MLKSGTWPGNVAVGPLSDMDSSGSCDSVISTNSGCSDDSMEHLTPEERACLMFLEETIEALDVQEDSGLSNDEPDPVTRTKDQIRVNGISSLASQSDSLGTPAAADPAHMTFTPEGETEHHALNQNSEPQSAPAPSSPLLESAPGRTSPSAANQTEVPGLTLNGACDPENVPSTWTCSEEETSEIDLSILPPPSDFKDDLDPDSQPEDFNDVPAPQDFSTEPEPHVEPVQLNSINSVNKISETSSLTQGPPPDASGSLINLPLEFTPPRSPPPVAPKPKKLPANIVLPSQKVAAGSSEGSMRPLPTSSDRLMEDHQKVHTEALRKLGLLKEKQEETSLVSKYRRSWNGPSPVSPAISHKSPPTPPYTHLSSSLQTSPSPQFVPSAAAFPVSPAPPPTQDPDVLPVPAAFCDSIRPLHSISKLPAGADVPDAAANTAAPASVHQLTSPKVTDMKSAAPQPPGEGLSFNLTAPNPAKADQRAIGEQSPQLSSRPRPASLGSRRDILSAKVEDLQSAPAASKQLDPQRLPHAHNVHQQSRESSKLPRSQGISVLICPRPENVEERRDALKKLGLLRD